MMRNRLSRCQCLCGSISFAFLLALLVTNSVIDLGTISDTPKIRARLIDCTIEIEKCIGIVNSSSEILLMNGRIRELATWADFITVAFVNSGYKEIANNWFCNWNAFPSLANSTIILPMDMESHNFMLHHWGSYRDNTVDIFLPDSAFSSYLNAVTEEAATLEILRWEIVRQILNQSPVPILVMDVDSVWLQNPAPLFEKLRLSSSDLWLSTKGFKEPDPRLSDRSTSIVFLKPTIRTGLNQLMDRIAVTAEFVEDAIQQMCDRKDLLKNISCSQVSWEEIPDGNWFDQPSAVKLSQAKPIAVHNNAILGRQPKISRFKQAGFWFTDPDYSCNVKSVEIVLESPSAYFGMGQIVQN